MKRARSVLVKEDMRRDISTLALEGQETAQSLEACAAEVQPNCGANTPPPREKALRRILESFGAGKVEPCHRELEGLPLQPAILFRVQFVTDQAAKIRNGLDDEHKGDWFVILNPNLNETMFHQADWSRFGVQVGERIREAGF